MFPNTERDIDTPTARRASSLAVILRFVLVFTSGSLIAHPVQAQPFPFQGGPGNNPEKMFELMFGADRPEEEEALKAVKISFTDERAFGQKILDAYLAELKLKKLPVVRKGRDVEYLQSLVAIGKQRAGRRGGDGQQLKRIDPPPGRQVDPVDPQLEIRDHIETVVAAKDEGI